MQTSSASYHPPVWRIFLTLLLLLLAMAFSSDFKPTALLAASIFLIFHHHQLLLAEAQLRVGFYSKTCPNVESIVRAEVERSTRSEPRSTALLLRLVFHDCFVEGCDGSILIDGEGREIKAFGNQGVSGQDIVARAKSQLEKACPGVVSCTDIVVLAARDAIALSNGPVYAVPTGRRDGRDSSITNAADLPEGDEPIEILRSKFKSRGLTDKDLVLLSAAHSIGTTACFFVQKRLYNFTGRSDADPAIDPQFLPQLRAKCPPGSNGERIPLDAVSENIMDDQILRNVKRGIAVLSSDARLNDDPRTRQILESYIGLGSSVSASTFEEDFAKAMVKLSLLGVKTGSQGEIRKVCNVVN